MTMKHVAIPEPKRVTKPFKLLDESDKARIEEMCRMQCTCAEMCQEFAMSFPTFQKNLKWLYKDDPTVRKPVSYTTVYAAYHVKGLTALRSALYKSALSGNLTAQIFLAKNWLGMSDNPLPPPVNSEAVEFAKAMKASVDSFAHDISGTAELVEESNIDANMAPPSSSDAGGGDDGGQANG